MTKNKEIFVHELPKVVKSISKFLRKKRFYFGGFDSFIFFFLPQELHAHINGSLSNDTLEKLSLLKYGTGAKHTEQYNHFGQLNLSE